MSAKLQLLEALSGPDAAAKVRALDAQGILTQMIPELEAGRGFLQPELHHYDVLDHCLAAVAAVDVAMGPGEAADELRAGTRWIEWEESLSRTIDGVEVRVLIRLSCLLHDVGKPPTATIIDERLRFPRHGPRGAELMQERLPQLGFESGTVDFVTRMIRQHLRPTELIKNWPASEHAFRRFVRDVDGYALPLMLVNLADGMATRGPRYTRDHFRRHCGFLGYVVARALAVAEPPDRWLITGEDLMEMLDLPSGRLLGAVLTSVRQAQAAGAVVNRDEALALARRELAALKAASS